jgi:molybdopterin/thiamine biosynthesis adenylyltransferase
VVVGAGGLGCAALQYLAAAGVGLDSSFSLKRVSDIVLHFKAESALLITTQWRYLIFNDRFSTTNEL